MTAVTGPPAKMRANREDLTPMLSQYYDLCAAYDEFLVLFQVGDFYETFCEAAEETARILELTLTQREDSTGTYPMTGIPIDNAASYVDTLLDAGYRVAIADQVEDASEASGLVDRAVTQIVTPGTVVDDELLSPGSTNYVACVASADSTDSDESDDSAHHAVAAVDVSTGECLVTSAADPERALEELQRVAPAEIVVGPNARVDPAALDGDAMRTEFDPDVFASSAARSTLKKYVPRPDAVVGNDAELRAVGALLAYAEYTQGDETLDYVSRIQRYDPRDGLRLDATALRSLELFESQGPSNGPTLFDVLDDTACALGRRRLQQWLRRPLVDRERIDARLDAVDELTSRSLVREDLHDHLRDVYDVERLVARVSRGRANARDLRSLKATLDVVPDVKDALEDADCDRLLSLRDSLDELDDVRDLIGRAIASDPPMEITEGGVIEEGFDAELDDLRATEREGRQWVADLESSERERTGIDSLSVGHNQVHGYYIEVTNANLDSVPDDYTRRQTLKNSERFYTPELKRREDEIFGASERADALEYELFREVRGDVGEESERIQSVADALATIDVLTTLASVAVENDYTRPELGADGIAIDGGRHPVVERQQDSFVPNPTDLTESRLALVTGPNMSGKSTYMRQVALIVVLAQVGSFVPANAARLPVVDRVFTRVGASDDIAGGQSTFMREMSELTTILHHATENSLVLLDEVGRGTSTTDGLAIARATTEFLHDEVGATTLFATHYHELTAVADDLPGVQNLHFTVERGDRSDDESNTPNGDADSDVTFLHRVAEGASSSSYGVEVARMAGVPSSVVARSEELVADSQSGDESGANSATANDSETPPPRPENASLASFSANGHSAERTDETPIAAEQQSADSTDDHLRDVAETLRSVDVATTTPLEALTLLNDLQRTLDE
ncbi:DNA mismatch repair protein MutS [Haloprofundus marisrubri]|uniref:DNA mismatch repair protein MutS n=1 Tax=Haloprofundus marisrubri TaxID=1514971 RepID=A0A0W1R6T4_9EURY|nr:DNA mismatch repair protein MutS [Haloprofundus marisrubri]KTG08823.1 DNA mismatch repair protein MutS [Haloprofundus marisrubri]